MTTATDSFEFPHGLDVDLDEGWPKIIARQFGGDPGRGFCELIQNAIDSYPPGMAWSDRLVRIATAGARLTITDWGEGMSRERLRLLTTLGGTDKAGDASRIGQFGIGFFAIFNPALGARRVTVTTRCEGHTVQLRFVVADPLQRPALELELLDELADSSTRIEVDFADPRSVECCLQAARQALRYYPCSATIDGASCPSVWEQAGDALRFNEEGCAGLIHRDPLRPWVDVLVKYEHVLVAAPSRLAAVRHEVRDDLRDLRWRGVPYAPDAQAIINCDDLCVTISRDRIFITFVFEKMIRALASALRRYLARSLARGGLANSTEVIVANQYILAEPLRQWLDQPGAGDPDDLLQQLAAAPIYALANRPERLSLLDIQRERTPGWPVWYAPRGSQLNWAGGAFLRDFIVLPPACHAGGGAPDLYPHLFDTLFGDVVNLDTIATDQARITNLVQRGIVSREALQPEARTLADQAMSPAHRVFLQEVNALLAREPVRAAVTKNLCLPVDALEAGYFELAASEAVADVATGLFDGEGQLLRDLDGTEDRRTVRIGLRTRHPLIEHLVQSSRPTRAYFALTYLAHELTRAQQRLVPDTPEFYFVRNSLTLDLRRGLLETLAPVVNPTA